MLLVSIKKMELVVYIGLKGVVMPAKERHPGLGSGQAYGPRIERNYSSLMLDLP